MTKNKTQKQAKHEKSILCGLQQCVNFIGTLRSKCVTLFRGNQLKFIHQKCAVNRPNFFLYFVFLKTFFIHRILDLSFILVAFRICVIQNRIIIF